jgi:hypothetical protein
MTLLKNWEQNVITIRHMRSVAGETAEMSTDWPTNPVHIGGASININSANYSKSRSVTLANQSSYEIPVIYVLYDNTKQANNPHGYIFGPHKPLDQQSFYNTEFTLRMPAPSDSFDSLTLVDQGAWHQQWSEIETKESETKDVLQNFADATYDGYEQGSVDISDLTSPMMAREDAPAGNPGAYTLQAMIQAEYGAPSDLQNIANMTVESGNRTYSGILLSDSLPPNQTFVVGETYNAESMPGIQYVASPSTGRLTTLSGNFTVTDAVGPDGDNITSVAYEDVDFDSTSVQGYKERLNTVKEKLAEVEARQQKMRQDVFGGGGLPSLPGFGTLKLLALAAAAAMFLLVLAAVS